MTPAGSDLHREKIWDPVSRLWHWVFAVAIVTNLLLGRFMDFDTVQWHFSVGYCILGLLAFRLIWGLVGPRPVRFASFFPSPGKVWRYLVCFPRRQPSGAPGHNPLGALSVFAILLVVLAQAFTGLFIEADDFFTAAILHDSVSTDTAKFMSAWHHTLPAIIVALVILHVGAILFYWLWKRENLITPMLHGWKWVRRK